MKTKHTKAPIKVGIENGTWHLKNAFIEIKKAFKQLLYPHYY